MIVFENGRVSQKRRKKIDIYVTPVSKIELLGPKLGTGFDQICLCIEMGGGVQNCTVKLSDS